MLAKIVALLKNLGRTTPRRSASKVSKQKTLADRKRAQQAARARNYINPWHNI